MQQETTIQTIVVYNGALRRSMKRSANNQIVNFKMVSQAARSAAPAGLYIAGRIFFWATSQYVLSKANTGLDQASFLLNSPTLLMTTVVFSKCAVISSVPPSASM